jgi:hypothetical protein
MNDTDESKGEWSGPWNCVYVVWAYRHGSLHLKSGVKVEHLNHPVICPDLEQWKKPPLILQVDESSVPQPEAADRILNALKLRRDLSWAEMKRAREPKPRRTTS